MSGAVTSCLPRLARCWLALLLSCTALASPAGVYPLPADGDSLVGEPQYVVARHEDTLLDIARRFDVGYGEMVAANPGVDPWLPGEGTLVRVPTVFVLPLRPWRGLVVNLAEMRLYYFPPPDEDGRGEVITHPLGIGREGWSTPLGHFTVVEKIERPSWTMPESVVAELAADGRPVRRTVPPGPDNPLGDYAIMLDAPGYFIHGTNKPYGVGMRVSHGCLRLYPEDIASLFRRLPRGTPVRIVDQPYKAGLFGGEVFIEAHTPLAETRSGAGVNLTPLVRQLLALTERPLTEAEWERVEVLAGRHRGMPEPLSADCALPACRGRLLQLAAFRDAARASGLAVRLRERMPSARALPCDAEGWCRVVAGPFHSQASLDAVARAMREGFGLEGVVLAGRKGPVEGAARLP